MLHALEMLRRCSSPEVGITFRSCKKDRGGFGKKHITIYYRNYMGQESGLEEARPFDRACKRNNAKDDEYNPET
jgi:hypothetical protein